MTLFSALRALPDMEVVGLNFSSATTPELLLKTFDHYCEYRKTPNGVVLSPVQVRLSELPSVSALLVSDKISSSFTRCA